eukprot:TRINITY_DN30332_c0_g1_i1.p1 TRINITY_DN30332_c0_g1~~TRINITY_DN30332_c0_g1_i1.p1  ORF type:complete len:1087 (+),score=290.29 TRINITY_DN30332_c0_g1_i1:73-3333(+)
MAAVGATQAVPTQRLRNICILAHVDHGKTTCADNLICSNNIISRHSAGKIRYLDSRRDEQERQITMKSSAIALKWACPGRPLHVVNLIDSPGHVDFSSEVSTAARLADGALVVVDVVEGVEAQTRTVLRQAWRDRVKTVLLLNKIDRLIIELDLTPLEAYQRLVNIVEQVNAINQQLISEDVMAKESEAPASAAAGSTDAAAEGIDLTDASGFLEFDAATEEAWRYSPERGNVAFGSAYHGWAFRIDTFAALVGAKMGAKTQAMQKVLWGEYFFNPKTKRAIRRKPDDTRTKPMFVQFVLEQLWKVYSATYKELDTDLLAKMQAQIPSWEGVDLKRLQVGTAATRELLSRWLPFANCVLEMAIDHLPSPDVSANERLPVLCPRWFSSSATESGTRAVPTAQAKGAEAGEAIVAGLQSSEVNAPAVVYLAKFLAADLERRVLSGDALVGEEDVEFVGICRVFAGTVRPGQELYVMQNSDDGKAKGTLRRFRAERLYCLKGRYLEELEEAPAGFIVAAKMVQCDPGAAAVTGREASELGVERSLTLCSEADGPCFETPYSTQAFAIVRVNIEPQNVNDSDALYRGLRLLHRADPSVTIEVRSSGENLLGCCGDEHLKRCITDLHNMYAKGVALRISAPLVAIRESLAASVDKERLDPKAPMHLPSWAAHLAAEASTEASSHLSGENHEEASDAGAAPQQVDRFSMSASGLMSVWTANRKACVKVSAMAIPAEVLDWMDANDEELETVVHRQRASPSFSSSGDSHTLVGSLQEITKQFEQRMTEAGQAGGSSSSTCPGTLCGISVNKGSRTVLLDNTGAGWNLIDSYQVAVANAIEGAEGPEGSEWIPRWMRPSILSGFQLASNAGPLSEEPMRAVAFVIQGCQILKTGEDAMAGGYGSTPSQPTAAALAASAEPYGPMSGQVMVAMKEACRCCLFRRGFARICEAMLSLEVLCEQEMLGKVYAVLGKRRVKVREEGMREGTSLFHISSYLPLADSFGLAHDLRSAASGQVSFHCNFSHWEQSEEDPFQEASMTAEEQEDEVNARGHENALPPNMARTLIDAIRKRKGLATEEKVVSVATKQRTISLKK